MNTKITLSQAIAGYLINLSARHLSQNTVNDYTNTLNKLTKQIGSDTQVSDIGIDQINAFLAGFTDLSNKTLSNYHSTLSTFFDWMIINKIITENPVNFVQRAKPERRVIDPLPEQEIKSLLDAVYHSKSYARQGKKTCKNLLHDSDRNVAIILFILDNGVRVSELCDLQIKDLDLKQLRAFILGKGSKERFVPFSPRTSQAIWRYHSSRGELYPDDFVFVTDHNRQLRRGYILKMLTRASLRAGISHVHPHRLRHTFSVNYLRAGGDIFTLQMILGHEHLEMVRHYSRLAQSDIKRAHRRASPVEFLRL
jgi:site-specific recombinase XerD